MNVANMLQSITKEATISIGLALSVLAIIIRYETRVNTLENQITFHLSDPNIHHAGFSDLRTIVDKHQERFITKDEAMIRLTSIQESIERIEKKLE